MDVHLPTDNLYRVLLDWFRSQKGVKVEGFPESKSMKIRVGIRGLSSRRINVNLEHGEMRTTRISFRFDFSEMYAFVTITTVCALILVWVFFGLETLLFCLIPLTFALLGVQYDIDKMKKKFVDKTRDFLAVELYGFKKEEGAGELIIAPEGSH